MEEKMEKNEDVGFWIKVVYDSMETNANRSLKKIGLTLSQAKLLAYLNDRKRIKTSQKDIEDFFKVTHPTVIGILNRLKQKGLIEKEFDDKDRRKYVTLTEEGRKMHKEMSNHRKKTEGSMMKDFSDKDAAKLISYLEKLYNNIQE